MYQLTEQLTSQQEVFVITTKVTWAREARDQTPARLLVRDNSILVAQA